MTSCHKTPDKILLADYVIKQHLTTNLDSAKIRQVIDTLLERTKWDKKIQINQTYNPDIVNIYVIDGSMSYTNEDERIRGLVSNCAYVGYNIVFLDDAYLHSFLDHHHVIKIRYNTALEDEQECFLYWAIGHELGHLVCGHLDGHFDPGSLDHFVKFFIK